MRSQYSVIGTPLTSSITKNGWPACGGAAVVDAGDVRVVHQGQRLALGVEPGQHRARVHADLDQLQRHLPLDRCGLLGPVDGAHPPLAEDFEQRVPAGDDLARDLIRRAVVGRLGARERGRPVGLPLSPLPTAVASPRRMPRSLPRFRVRSPWDIRGGLAFQEPAGPVVGGEQHLDPPAEGGVAPTGSVQVGGPPAGSVRSRASAKMVINFGSASGIGSPPGRVLLPQCPVRDRQCATESEISFGLPAASFQPGAVAGMVDQHPPHRFRRGGEEVPTTVEVLVPDQPQISLMHQGRGIEAVPRPLRGHPRNREPSQFSVDEREQVGRRLAVVGRHGVEEVCEVRCGELIGPVETRAQAGFSERVPSCVEWRMASRTIPTA